MTHAVVSFIDAIISSYLVIRRSINSTRVMGVSTGTPRCAVCSGGGGGGGGGGDSIIGGASSTGIRAGMVSSGARPAIESDSDMTCAYFKLVL